MTVFTYDGRCMGPATFNSNIQRHQILNKHASGKKYFFDVPVSSRKTLKSRVLIFQDTFFKIFSLSKNQTQTEEKRIVVEFFFYSPKRGAPSIIIRKWSFLRFSFAFREIIIFESRANMRVFNPSRFHSKNLSNSKDF